MSKTYALQAEARDGAGKGAARALRRDKKVPAVIYGDGKAAASISLPVKEINLEYLKGRMFTSLCNLSVDGQDNLVLARDVQLDPVKDIVLHVDFLRVTPKTTIKVRVPVHFMNHEDCLGLIKKGSLNVVRHDIEMVCLATDIPESINVDLSGVDVGESIHISAVQLPKGARPAIDDRDFTIATITPPRRIIDDEAPVEGESEGEGEAAAESAE